MLNDNNASHGETVIFAPEATHPTAAPFDHRDMHENAIGVIGNGCVVQVLQDGADDGGRPWSFVATLDGHPVGWVYRELISYN